VFGTCSGFVLVPMRGFNIIQPMSKIKTCFVASAVARDVVLMLALFVATFSA
jgi:hypothetical protein